jgi:hypothetical protein
MKDQAKAFVLEDMTVEHMITGTSSQGPGDLPMSSQQVSAQVLLEHPARTTPCSCAATSQSLQDCQRYIHAVMKQEAYSGRTVS